MDKLTAKQKGEKTELMLECLFKTTTYNSAMITLIGAQIEQLTQSIKEINGANFGPAEKYMMNDKLKISMNVVEQCRNRAEQAKEKLQSFINQNQNQ